MTKLWSLGIKDRAIISIEDEIKRETELSRFLYSYLPLTELLVYDSLRDKALFREIMKRKKEKYVF